VSDKPVDKILAEALKAVSDAKLPDDLRVVGFEKAVELIAAQAGMPITASAGAGSEVSDGGSGSNGEADNGGGKSLDTVAAKLGIDVATIKDVFHADDEAPGLTISSSQLDDSKAKATRQIALLIAAARQAGGWDVEWTNQSDIRAVCDHYNRADGKNFATTIGSMKNEFGFKGSGPSRQVRLKQTGWEEAVKVVKQLVGQPS
jgi:hypothetical protein